MKLLNIAKILLFSTVCSTASAAVILADDFSGVSKTGSTATISAWDTEIGFDAGTTFTASDNYFDVQSGMLDVDASVFGGSGPGWDITFTLDLDANTSSVSLDSLYLLSVPLNNAGVIRTRSDGPVDWTLSITGNNGYNGGSTAVVVGTSASFAGTSSADTAIDLTTLPDLVANETYTFNLFVENNAAGNDTYMGLDDFSLTGTVTAIPEPSALALLGLTGLAALFFRWRINNRVKKGKA
jgi:hypothetical protein